MSPIVRKTIYASRLPKSTQRLCLWTFWAAAESWIYPSSGNWFTEVTASGKSSLPALMFQISSNTRGQLQVPLMTAASLHEMKAVFLSAERKIKCPSVKYDLTLSLRSSPWTPGTTDCAEFTINREKDGCQSEYIYICVCVYYSVYGYVCSMHFLLGWF